MVTLALIPYLALSAALDPLVPIISEELHMSTQAMSLGSGLGNAAYAVGTVLAVQFAQHLPQRRMMLLYAVLLVVGSVLSAAAQGPGMYIAGHVLQGLTTSMLLIAAAPPLTIGFPKDKLRNTAVIMNMCVFGAVALGPFVGGVQAEAHAWRPLFWVVAAIALMALVMAALTFDDAPPADLDAPRDLPAIGLAAVGCAAGFIGAAQLTSHGFTDAAVTVPLFGGLTLIVVLIVYQFRARRPLLTVRTMLTSSIPVAGVGVALFAAAASVAATALTANVLLQNYSPVRVGLLYLPELGGAVLMAFVFGTVISRRAMHYLPLAGMALLAAGIVVFRIALPTNQPLVLVAAALTGLALGATVAPALFVAGFSLQSASLQRVFAIIELLRAVAAFMVAPILAHFAVTASSDLNVGTGYALWIGFGLAIGGALFGVAIYALSGARPQRPNLDRFLDGESPPGTRRPYWPESGQTCPPRLLRPNVPQLFRLRVIVTMWLPPGRCSSPTTDPNSLHSPSRKPLPSWRLGETPWLCASGSPWTLDSHRSASNTSTPTRPPRYGEPLSTRLPMGRRWPARPDSWRDSVAVEAAPTWKGIVQAADEHQASLIVLGPHRRSGLLGHLQGSVAAAVVAHCSTPVLIVPSGPMTNSRTSTADSGRSVRTGQ